MNRNMSVPSLRIDGANSRKTRESTTTVIKGSNLQNHPSNVTQQFGQPQVVVSSRMNTGRSSQSKPFQTRDQPIQISSRRGNNDGGQLSSRRRHLSGSQSSNVLPSVNQHANFYNRNHQQNGQLVNNSS